MFVFSVGHKNPSCYVDYQSVDCWENLFIYDNHLIFRSGRWTDALYLHGTRYGRIGPEGDLRKSVLVREDQCIDEVGICNFNGMNVIPFMKITAGGQELIASSNIKSIEVDVSGGNGSSDNDRNTYHYIRSKMGLQVQLVAVGTSERGVQAMTWAFHKVNHLTFNKDEFRNFWDWLIDEVYESQHRRNDCQCHYHIQKKENDEKEEKKDVQGPTLKTKRDLAKFYENEFNYVCNLFEKNIMSPNLAQLNLEKKGRTTLKSPVPHYIDSTEIIILNTKHISMYLNKNGTSSLLIENKFIDTSGGRDLTTSGLPDDKDKIAMHILADMISQSCCNKQLIEECVNIHAHKSKYVGVENGQALVFLFAQFGANLILRDEEQDDWDIYNICALHWSFGDKKPLGKMFAAIVCFIIQIFSPIFLTISAVHAPGQEIIIKPIEPIDFNSRLLTSVVLMYLLAWNHKLLTSADSERKLAYFLLVYLTAKGKIFSRNFVLAGFLANTLAYFLITVGTIVILVYPNDPIDVVLNSLALLFIKDIDNDLVDGEYVGDIQADAESQLSSLFSQKLPNIFHDDDSQAHAAWKDLKMHGLAFSKFHFLSKTIMKLNMVMLAFFSFAVLFFQIKMDDQD